MKILFKNALILSMRNERIVEGELLVIDTRIAYIGKDASGYAPFDRVIDCQGNLIMPGLKNAHTHSAMIFLRDKGKNLSLQDWLFKFVFPREARLIPSDIYHLNKVAFLEYIASGTTACFDQYFFPPEGVKAAEEMGMRMLTMGMYDEKLRPVDVLAKYYRFYNDKKDGLVRFIIGMHAEYTSNPELISKTKEALELLKSPFYTHVSETKKEVDECVGRHGVTPLKYLFDQGLYKYGGGAYHCVHFTDGEVKICEENHIFMVSCPGSNIYLSSGTAPLSKYLKSNVNIALGTDGPASNESLDMFREMRLAATREGVEIPPFEILKMATVNGAHAMYFDDADVLDVGKYADLIMVDLSKSKSKKSKDIIYDLVHKYDGSSVKLTMINGKILYENGQHNLNQSIEEIYKNADEATRRLEKDL